MKNWYLNMIDILLVSSAVYCLVLNAICAFLMSSPFEIFSDFLYKLILRKRLFIVAVFPAIGIVSCLFWIYVALSDLSSHVGLSHESPWTAYFGLLGIICVLLLCSVAGFLASCLNLMQSYEELDAEYYIKASHMKVASNVHYFRQSKLTYSDYFNIEHLFEIELKNDALRKNREVATQINFELENIKKKVLLKDE